MSAEQYREIKNGAPVEWDATMRLVALMIADECNKDTRRTVGLRIEGYWTRRGCWRAGIAEMTGLKPETVSKALQRLARAGYEMRIPMGTGKDGRPVFAMRGHASDYQVPLLPTRPEPIRPDDVPPLKDSRPGEVPCYRIERPEPGLQRPEPGPPRSPHVSPHKSYPLNTTTGSLRSLLSDPPLRSGSDSSSRTSRQRAKGKTRPAQRTANGWVWSSAPEVVTLRERFAESGMSSTDLKRDARLTRPGVDRFLSGVGQTSRLALARIEQAIDAAEAALRA